MEVKTSIWALTETLGGTICKPDSFVNGVWVSSVPLFDQMLEDGNRILTAEGFVYKNL